MLLIMPAIIRQRAFSWHVPATDDSLVFVLVCVFVFIFVFAYLYSFCIRSYVSVCVCVVVDKLTTNVNGMQIICATWSMALH